MEYIKSPSLNQITDDSINSCKTYRNAYHIQIPIKIIVLGFVGESQPTCCSTDRITVANFGVPSPYSKLDSLAFRSHNKDVS